MLRATKALFRCVCIHREIMEMKGFHALCLALTIVAVPAWWGARLASSNLWR